MPVLKSENYFTLHKDIFFVLLNDLKEAVHSLIENGQSCSSWQKGYSTSDSHSVQLW